MHLQSEIRRLEHLRHEISASGAEVPYSEILEAIDEQAPRTPFHLFVKGKKLFEGQARLEYDGFLINPFFSVVHDGTRRKPIAPNTDVIGLIHSIEREQWHKLDSDNAIIFFMEQVYEPYFNALAELVSVFYKLQVYPSALSNATRRYQHVFDQSQASFPPPTFDDLAAFIKEKFNVSAVFFRRVSSEKVEIFNENVFPLLQDAYKEIEESIFYCIENHRGASGTLSSRYREKLYYKIFPVRGVLRTQIETVGCFVLMSGNRIADVCSLFVERTANEVYFNRHFYQRSRLLASLHDEMNRFSAAGARNFTLRQRDAAFKRFASRVVQAVCATTNAHSATIRRYDPFDRSLRLVAYEEVDTGRSEEPAGARKRTRTRRSIAVDDWGVSANAFCFMRVPIGGHLYLPNLNVIPGSLKAKGLTTVYRPRPASVSEICVPVYWQSLRIGVLNLEGSFESAFEGDEEYIRTLSFLISQFWSVVHTSTDRYWLSRLSFTHLAMHELEEFRRTLGPKGQKDLSQIVSTLSVADFSDSDRSTLFDAHIFTKKEVKRLCPQADPDEVVMGPSEARRVRLSPAMNASLRLILQSIVSNAQKHSRLESDRIETTMVRRPAKEPVEIQIKYASAASYVDPEEAERFFYRPVQDRESLHFGLFLIGAHARLLGGTIAIDPACLKPTRYGPLRYIVRIPSGG